MYRLLAKENCINDLLVQNDRHPPLVGACLCENAGALWKVEGAAVELFKKKIKMEVKFLLTNIVNLDRITS